LEKNFREYKFIDKINYVTGKKPSNCIFCNPTELILFESDQIVILLNKYPYNPAHLLIAPKRHIGNLEDLTDSEISILMNAIKKTMRLIKKVYSPNGFNMGLNQGKVAGASLISHLHFHLVPRYENELGFMDVTAGTRIIVEKLEDTLKKLKNEIDILKD